MQEDSVSVEDFTAAPPTSNTELAQRCESIKNALTNDSNPHLVSHGTKALDCFDQLRASIDSDGSAIKDILDDTRNELIESYLAAISGRNHPSWLLLRGVMEGLFSSLYYRQQSISLNLWASGRSFEMLHSMLSGEHCFRLYYKQLFEDERFRSTYPGVGAATIFKEATAVYDDLSNFVHKKSPLVRSRFTSKMPETVERIFRIFIAFLEADENLPTLGFPAPASYSALLCQPRNKS